MVETEPPRRRHVQARSRLALLAVAARPRWLLPVAAAVLLGVGLSGSGVLAFLALVAVAGLLGWLATVSWPAVDPQGRLLRVAAVVVLLVVAVLRLAAR